MEQIFTKDDILCAIKYAIRELNDKDELLLNIHCSERSQVHWLAIYFDKKIREIYHRKKATPNFPEDYVVDVEYNRVTSTPDNTKQIPNLCSDCRYDSENCKKKHTDNVTVDMIFHRRGSNDIDSNIFCLEVKPSHNKESKCDQKRICELVTGAEFGSKPIYQYGLALHLLEKDKQRDSNPLLADGRFYINNKNEEYKMQKPLVSAEKIMGNNKENSERFMCYKTDA